MLCIVRAVHVYLSFSYVLWLIRIHYRFLMFVYTHSCRPLFKLHVQAIRLPTSRKRNGDAALLFVLLVYKMLRLGRDVHVYLWFSLWFMINLHWHALWTCPAWKTLNVLMPSLVFRKIWFWNEFQIMQQSLWPVIACMITDNYIYVLCFKLHKCVIGFLFHINASIHVSSIEFISYILLELRTHTNIEQSAPKQVQVQV